VLQRKKQVFTENRNVAKIPKVLLKMP